MLISQLQWCEAEADKSGELDGGIHPIKSTVIGNTKVGIASIFDIDLLCLLVNACKL